MFRYVKMLTALASVINLAAVSVERLGNDDRDSDNEDVVVADGQEVKVKVIMMLTINIQTIVSVVRCICCCLFTRQVFYLYKLNCLQVLLCKTQLRRSLSLIPKKCWNNFSNWFQIFLHFVWTAGSGENLSKQFNKMRIVGLSDKYLFCMGERE